MKHKFHVILTGRNKEKLEGVRKGLQESFPDRQVIAVISDATKPESAESLADDLIPPSIIIDSGQIDQNVVKLITVLVNNVGIGADRLQVLEKTKVGMTSLERTPLQMCKDMMAVNCYYPTVLTRVLLPRMRKVAGPGHPLLVINVASIAGILVCPSAALYCATKAFSTWLSISMAADDPSIEILSVNPGMCILVANRHFYPLFYPQDLWRQR